MIMKGIFVWLTLTCCFSFSSFGQNAEYALIGYWHNWNDANAPYIPLDEIDSRYNVIQISFAIPLSANDMNMVFSPDGVSQNELISKIQTLQNEGKKVLLSIGGATASVDLATAENKGAFVNTLNEIIGIYGFDGIDIDIEHGSSILINGGTIASPNNISQVNLIDAIKEIMENYRAAYNKKLFLTMAPETAYVQGGQSAFGSIWGGYLPIIDALRDSIDILHVQLYNSGTMFGIDGNIYTQGTADFIVACTEAAIQGFNTAGGMFEGLPASKVAVGLPSCESAAGGGFVDSATVKSAIDYLRGNGPQPGNYVLSNSNAYPSLRGMMTWSINWDAVSSCGNTYQYANNYQNIFEGFPAIQSELSDSNPVSIFPNPTNGQVKMTLPSDDALIIITNLHGQEIVRTQATQQEMSFRLEHNGIYIVYITSQEGTSVQKLMVRP